MRLTLRTLLAYLDDRLPPANAREIGKKLAASPFAQELADRIRSVVRQRRLSVPGRQTKAIDPNLIAEYLDDQLTPELVALVEKEVLASDFSLAEVAASHEIIGLLGDPVLLDERQRARLIRLNPDRPAEETTDHELEQFAATKTSDPSQEIWQPMAPQRTFSPRSPTLVLTILLVAWIVVFFMDRDLWTTSSRPTDPEMAQAASQDLQTTEAGKAAKKPEPIADSDPDDVSVEARETEASRDGEVPTSDRDASSAVSEERPSENIDGGPAEADETASEGDPESADDAGSQPDSTAMADDSTADPADSAFGVADTGHSDSAVPSTDPDSTPATEAESEADVSSVVNTEQERRPRRFRFAVEATNDMLLIRRGTPAEWIRGASLHQLNPDWHDTLVQNVAAISLPYVAHITPLRSGCTISLLPPSLASFSDGVSPGIRLYDGRCIVKRDEALPEGEPAAFTLMAGQVHVECFLEGAEVRAGLSVFAVPPEPSENGSRPLSADERDILPLTNDVMVELFVVQGQAQVHLPDQEPLTVGNGRSLYWAVRNDQVDDLAVSPPDQLDAIPEWVHTGDAPPVRATARAAAILASELMTAPSLTDAAVELADHRNSITATYAAALLAVCRDADRLVIVLTRTSEESVRTAAIMGLRRTAAQAAAGREAVLKALGNRLPATVLDDFVRLLQGISPAQAQNPETSAWLVEQLDHDRVEIRHMAFLLASELTGEDFGYHPDADRRRRRDAVQRWQKHLKRHDGCLVSPQ